MAFTCTVACNSMISIELNPSEWGRGSTDFSWRLASADCRAGFCRTWFASRPCFCTALEAQLRCLRRADRCFTPASMEVVPTTVIERIYTVVELVFAMVAFSTGCNTGMAMLLK